MTPGSHDAAAVGCYGQGMSKWWLWANVGVACACGSTAAPQASTLADGNTASSGADGDDAKDGSFGSSDAAADNSSRKDDSSAETNGGSFLDGMSAHDSSAAADSAAADSAPPESGATLDGGAGSIGEAGADGGAEGGESSAAPSTGATAIAVGDGFTCELLGSGAVECWGGNLFGQLGSTAPTSTVLTPVGQNYSSTPVEAMMPEPQGYPCVTGISSNTEYTCALGSCGASSTGIVWCWGNNQFGQLGANATQTSSAAPVAITNLMDVKAISAGMEHACALASGGTVECWGFNGSGQLGNGKTTGPDPCDQGPCSLTPVTVSNLTGVTAIAAGSYHTCALLSGGTVDCWGLLGLDPNAGAANNSLVPTAVSNLSGVVAITAGQGFTCALLSAGSVECWGHNDAGQLGDGTTVDSSTPVLVSNITGATVIAAGTEHACALVSGGAVACWGYNGAGQLGNGTTSASPVAAPSMVMNITGATAISASFDHTCALRRSGAVECWGANDYGGLGNGTTTGSPTPVAVVQ